MNPHERLQSAFNAACEGRHEEALREYIWFHDHALEHEPALYGVRTSFALAYWVELAQVYPEAKTALEEIRDRKVGMLLSGQGDRRTFYDVASINYYLVDEPRTAEVFATLDKTHPALANQCSDAALPALVGSKLFALARQYVPEPFTDMYEQCTRFNECVDDLASEPLSKAPRLEAYVYNYAESIRLLVEILRGTGESGAAEALLSAAVERVKSPRVREAVRDALS